MIEARSGNAVLAPAVDGGCGGLHHLGDGARSAQTVDDNIGIGEHEDLYAIIGSQSQAESCDNRDCDSRKFGFNSPMDPYAHLSAEAADIFRVLDDLKLRQRDLAVALGLEENKISKVKKGERQFKAAELLAAREWLATAGRPSIRQGPTVHPDIPPTRGVADGDGMVMLKQINLGFAMGDGTNLDDYFEESEIGFDPNQLRAISRAPSTRLIVAHGAGDSMQPTLLDSDTLVIDTTQTKLNMMDRIWAISLYGAGAVKRLRPAAEGKVEIISDNPIHGAKLVSAEDVRIIGRVVWSGRRH
ncbi:S24 family peptidase [Sphingobium chungbukense]|uniref:S24 family peptidase n=1 Tax=Sphingobium chungbukense TaxID=56193 RepID=UPI0012EE25B5|nr:LexA family transcriptional regulator [Sphingobium chungbukense]